ncbi:hypothetical protein N7470_009712 [Penicillium chermesinum]|nr:hypothetical protein N7470_009712 [Penicillium chermesinum]
MEDDIFVDTPTALHPTQPTYDSDENHGKPCSTIIPPGAYAGITVAVVVIVLLVAFCTMQLTMLHSKRAVAAAAAKMTFACP